MCLLVDMDQNVHGHCGLFGNVNLCVDPIVNPVFASAVKDQIAAWSQLRQKYQSPILTTIDVSMFVYYLTYFFGLVRTKYKPINILKVKSKAVAGLSR